MLKDEIDFLKIIRYFLKAWPYFAISLILWLVVGIYINKDVPPFFEAKTSILIEKPQRYEDPNRIIVGMQPFEKEGTNYFVNQRINLKTHPLIFNTLIKLPFDITYQKKGILLYKDIYKNSPFYVELDDEKMTFIREETPYNIPFQIQFIDYKKFSLEASGNYPYPLKDKAFELSGVYNFSEWIDTLGIKFKVSLVDTSIFKKRTLGLENPLENSYAFVINDMEDLTLNYVDGIEVLPQEIDASIMSLSLKGSNKQKLLDFFTTLNQTFIETHLEHKTGVLRSTLKTVESEINRLKDLIALNEENIKDYRKAYGLQEISRKAEMVLGRIIELENDKINIQSRQEYYGYLKNLLQTNKDIDQLISPEAYGIQDQVLIKLTQDLVTLQLEKNAFEKQGNTQNPVYQNIVSNIQANKRTILETVSGFEKSNDITLQTMEKRVAELEYSLASLPEAEKQLVRLEREFNANNELYNDYQRKRSELEISISSIAPDFRVNEQPYITSTEPFFPNPILVFPVAIILGLFTPIAILGIRRLLSNKVLETSDVLNSVQEKQYLGNINYANISNPLFADITTNKVALTDIEKIYTNLLFRTEKPLKKIVFTSHKHGEGKYYIAVSLAKKLSLEGKKVVLVNLNIYHKKYQNQLNVNEKYTHTKNNLITNYTISDTLHYVVLHDYIQNNAEDIIQVYNDNSYLKADCVIYITPPYSSMPGVLSLCKSSDASIWVVGRKKSTLPELYESQQVIHTNNLNTVFFCLNYTFEHLNILGLQYDKYKNRTRNPWNWVIDLFNRL